MKKNTLIFFAFLFVSHCIAQNNMNINAVSLIPRPVSVIMNQGFFILNKSTVIIGTDIQASDIADLTATFLNRPTGYHLSVTTISNKKDNVIIFRLISNTEIGNEGYILTVSPKQILIEANRPAGLFYGMQTMLQMFPSAIESPVVVNSINWNIRCVRILDYPRFGWRGLMLDVSRHFFPKEFIKRYIDMMVTYKLNVFHWHLSDDQGWRIEIKGLPKLTEVGAWRVPRTGTWGTFDPAHPGEKATDGGYYSQEDIREVVSYAKRRFVTILPEIDVPGHSRALNAAYPGLSCTNLQYGVEPGTRYFREDDNTLCVANDSTILVLDKIFTQVAELFPGDYIHVGGDEVHAEYWQNDPKEQRLMKQEGIKSLEDLHHYFERKIEKIIRSKRKKMIGWYDLDDQLASETAFMSWTDMSTGFLAIKTGHPVVMAPSHYCYLDNDQGTVTGCYKFDPEPDGGHSTYMLGAEACLWTERVPNRRQVEFMTWPRTMALAEVFWSPQNQRNPDDFLVRLQDRLTYLDAAQVKYSRKIFDPIITGVNGGRICQECDDSIKVNISTEIPGLDIYYSFDGTNPDNFYQRYTGKSLGIPKGASEIRVITYRHGIPAGRQVNCLLSELGQQ